MKMVPSCKKWPLKEQCAYKGPGDFMGHSCKQVPQTMIEEVEDLLLEDKFHSSCGYQGPQPKALENAILALARRIDELGVK